jgi:1-acyl-sn-glycerol-3-phosphate acyltransferase
MESVFLAIYRFFRQNRFAFWLTFLGSVVVMALGASRIDLEEDITKFFPDDERVEKLNYIFQNSAFAEQVVVMVSIADSSITADPDTLVNFTSRLVSSMSEKLSTFSTTIKDQIDDQKMIAVSEIIRENLPVFLDERDYRSLDSISNPRIARQILAHNYHQLLSPSGVVLKKIIVNDPMGFSFLALKKLRQLQYDDNFELYENYILTKDHRHMIFFIRSGISSGDTGKNAAFVNQLDEIIDSYNENVSGVKVSCFGSTVIGVGNARVLRKDTILTLSLLVVLLAIFIFGYFRMKRMLFLILVPALYGGLFSLFLIYVFKGSVSILALAAGSIILGIAVNYALHFLVHLRHHPDHESVIKDLVGPLTLGSSTTVLAFFSLRFTNAAVLKDMGLFAAISLIGAALCALIFLPHFIKVIPQRESRIDKIFFRPRASGKIPVAIILLITPALLYFASDVSFNSDMSRLNYMNAETREAEQRIQSINPASLVSIYLSAEGASLEKALRKNEVSFNILDSLKTAGIVSNYHTPSVFLISDSLQQIRINQWNDYWTNSRRKEFLESAHDESKKLKFSPSTIANIDSVIHRKYSVLDSVSAGILRQSFFEETVLERNGQYTIVSLINAKPEHKSEVYAALKGSPGSAFDRQMIMKLFIEFVHDDFNFIVMFTSILVFVVLLISSGRIEITFITFAPMLVTWIWILGIMALLNIEFNIINVMISTFIFGLGDDYSIFVMDGLQQEYRTGKSVLPSVRTSIFLSAITTISGLGVLIFAEHPALRSIAAIAIIGIVCVFVMSQTLEPFLFDLLITRRTKKGLPPMTFKGIVCTIATYGLFTIGSFILTIIGLLFRIIPFGKKNLKYLYHVLIRVLTFMIMHLAFNLRIRVINEGNVDLNRPSVIIANHSSFIDILLSTMLHPKIILLTNKWVWNSPVFGGVVRLADYYPVVDGVEDSIDRLREKVNDGYSIVAFPEGTRSVDGKIQRFHKGAFFIAEKIRLPIVPLLIHGASYAVPKGTVYVNEGNVTLKLLNTIDVDDQRFGVHYAERSKLIGRYFRAEFNNFQTDQTTSMTANKKVRSNYLYKGPVLEWYFRIKLILEDNYRIFDRLIPRNARVLDLGCGYGFLCYMLHQISGERTLIGVDYDAEKIEVALNGYLRSEQMSFYCDDILTFGLSGFDVIVISDVLHYLLPEQQKHLLHRAITSLSPGGKIIIRDGNADLKKQHKATKMTEFLSVRILKFNKSVNTLNFFSGNDLKSFVETLGAQFEIVDQGKVTSNSIFVITKV